MFSKVCCNKEIVNSKTKLNLAGLVLGVLVSVVLIGCGGSSSSESGESESGESESVEVSESDATPISIGVDLTDNAFTLTDSTVKVGQEVTFNLVNSGAAIHNMIFEGMEFKSEIMINPGATSSFQATFVEPGVYRYVCSFHMPNMVGEITVES